MRCTRDSCRCKKKVRYDTASKDARLAVLKKKVAEEAKADMPSSHCFCLFDTPQTCQEVIKLFRYPRAHQRPAHHRRQRAARTAAAGRPRPLRRDERPPRAHALQVASPDPAASTSTPKTSWPSTTSPGRTSKPLRTRSSGAGSAPSPRSSPSSSCWPRRAYARLTQAFIYTIRSSSKDLKKYMNLEFVTNLPPFLKYMLEEYVPGLWITGLNSLNLLIVDKISRPASPSDLPPAHRVHHLPQVHLPRPLFLHAPQHVSSPAHRHQHRQRPLGHQRLLLLETGAQRLRLRHQRYVRLTQRSSTRR